MAKTVDTLLIEIKAETAKLKAGLADVNKKLDQTKQKSKSVGDSLKQVGAVLATLGVGVVLGNIVNTIRTFEDLEATLRAVTGSAKNAALSFDLIREFTSRTTFQIDEVARAFITLKQAGVVPTAGVLQDFGNFAAGMGKSITDLAQAAFNATTGEMEMLKQFGVIARQQGDKITVTFDGVTTTIDRSGSAVIDFLRSIGREKFPTAIAERANTLSGAISNLQDAISEFFVAIGDGGFAQALTSFSRRLAAILNNAKGVANVIGVVLTGALKLLTEPILLAIENLRVFLSLLIGASVAAVIANIGTITTAFKALSQVIQNLTVAQSILQAIQTRGVSILVNTGIIAAASTAAYGALSLAFKETAEEGDTLAEKSKAVEDNITVTIDPVKRLSGSVLDLANAFKKIKPPELTIQQIINEAGGLKNVLDKLEGDFVEFRKNAILDLEKTVFGEAEPTMLRGTETYFRMLGINPAEFDFRSEFFKTIFGMSEEDFMRNLQIELLPVDDRLLFDSLTKATDATALLNQEFKNQNPEFFKEKLEDMADFLREEFGLTVDEAAEKLSNFFGEGEKEAFVFSDALEDALTASSLAIADEFVQALRGGEDAMESFKNLALRIVDQVVAAFIQMSIIDPIIDSIFSNFGNDTPAPETSSAGSGSVGMAGGGAMHSRMPKLVGERGPELFVPHASGTLLNNMNTRNALGGGQTVVVNQSVNFATGVQATVRNEVLQLMPQIADATKSAVSESAERNLRFRGALQGA
tara:strand:+ start:30979 stop:33246 length:2268 start_codon:yes stop_codon:yes gene_type:complete